MDTNRVSRFMGGIWIFTSLLWGLLSVLAVVYGLQWLERTQAGLDENLGLVADSLSSVTSLIVETTDVISATHQSLSTVGVATEDATATLTDMRPLIWKTTKVISEDVPVALDGVQESMPSLIETAKLVDESLTWIADFQIAIPIPFRSDYVFDFGVDYAPEVPLDQSLEEMSGNLASVPEDLRSMEEDLDSLDLNLVGIRDDLSQLSENIEDLNAQINEVYPELEALTESLSDIESSFAEVQEGLPAGFARARMILFVLMGLLLLSQIPTLFVGWLLAGGKFQFLSEDEKA